MSRAPAADLELAMAAARSAGDTVMRYFGRDIVVDYKAPDQPVTAADRAADRLLREVLTAARPDYGWLSEETRDAPDRLARERVWIVDPIDGTRSFVAGRPEFSISIGLAVAGAVVAGVVYNPARDELYSALHGGGAYLQTAGGAPQRLGVRARADGVRALLMASRSELAAGEFDALQGAWDIEPVGSTAYKLARVAAGSGDAFLSRGPKSEWDICAGALLVMEAGGRATDLSSRAPRFNNADPYVHGIVAAAAGLHEALMTHIAMLPLPDRLRQGEDG
jgi:myo-inositol-1(or 4)-monophosphatase